MAEASKKRAKAAAGVKPKRPMSAYNYYFRDKRRQTALDAERSLAAAIDGGATTTMQSTQSKKAALFSVVGRQVGEKWKNLAESEKQPYVEMANRDMKRYQAEMMDYQIDQARKRICQMKSGGEDVENISHTSSSIAKSIAQVEECNAVKSHSQNQKAPSIRQGNNGIQQTTGCPDGMIEPKNYSDVQSSDNFLKKQQVEREKQFAAYLTVEIANKVHHINEKMSPPVPSHHHVESSFHQSADLQPTFLNQGRPTFTFLPPHSDALKIDSWKRPGGARVDLPSTTYLEIVVESPSHISLVPSSCDGKVWDEQTNHQTVLGGSAVVDHPRLLQESQPNNPTSTTLLLQQLLSQLRDIQMMGRQQEASASFPSASGLEKILQMLQEQQEIRAENDRLRSLLRQGEQEINSQPQL